MSLVYYFLGHSVFTTHLMIQGLAQLYNKQRKNILNHFFSGSCYAQEGMKNTKKISTNISLYRENDTRWP